MDKIENIFIGFLKFTSYVNSLFSVFSSTISYIILQANFLSVINPSFKVQINISESSSNNKQKEQNSLTNEDKGEYNIEGFHNVKEKDRKIIFSELSRDIGKFSENCVNYYKSKTGNSNLKNKNGELEWKFLESLSLSKFSFNNNSETINNNNDGLINYTNNNSDSSLGKIIFEDIGWVEESSIPELSSSEDHISQKYIYPKNINVITQINRSTKNVCVDTDIDEVEDNLKKQYKLAIVRRFPNECTSNNNQTFIVRTLNDKKNFTVYSQGDPHEIKAICEVNTIPENFEDLIESYKKKGENILAFCGRTRKMNYLQSQKIERKSCEKNMIFLGIIVYKYDGFKDIS